MTDQPIHHRPLPPAVDLAEPDDLLRPEPTTDKAAPARGGVALFALVFAGLAVAAIYASAPVDLPEYPDCPVQAIGTCGQH